MFADCFTGDIRLVGGSTEAEGTVEICFDSLWGLIDESGWGLNDAHVVCEQLGYGIAGKSEHNFIGIHVHLSHFP